MSSVLKLGAVFCVNFDGRPLEPAFHTPEGQPKIQTTCEIAFPEQLTDMDN
jgi:hypothetical protein